MADSVEAGQLRHHVMLQVQVQRPKEKEVKRLRFINIDSVINWYSSFLCIYMLREPSHNVAVVRRLTTPQFEERILICCRQKLIKKDVID